MKLIQQLFFLCKHIGKFTVYTIKWTEQLAPSPMQQLISADIYNGSLFKGCLDTRAFVSPSLKDVFGFEIVPTSESNKKKDTRGSA